jgi:uncharacterized protein
MTDRFDPFWAGCARGVLLVTRCDGCAHWHWYPPLACPCGTGRLVWKDVGRTGTVFSFTVAHRSFLPPGAVDLPFPVALVEPDAAPGVRLLGHVVGVEPAVGQRVSVDFRDGVPVFLNS